MFDRDVPSTSYCSTSRTWHIGGKLLCRSHRNVEQRKPKSGHWGWWSHCVPKWRLAIADVTNRNLNACRNAECFGYLTTCHCCFLCRSLAHTLIQNKNMWRIYENFHFWYMQEVLQLVGISLCLPDMEKWSYPSMTCPMKPLQTSAIFMLHAAPRTNCWKGPSFSVEAAGESMSFERKSHGWIRIRTFSSIFKGRTCMFGIVWLLLLAIPFLFCACENHKTAKCMVNLENAWKVFQISQALQKQHQQNIQPGWWRSWRQVLNWKWWCWNTNNHHSLPKERWDYNIELCQMEHKSIAWKSFKTSMLWANSHGCICIILYGPIVIYNLNHIIRLPFLFDTADTRMEWNGMDVSLKRGCLHWKGMCET